MIEIPAPDSQRLITALGHREQLDAWHTWSPADAQERLRDMGEHLFRIAFPNDAAVGNFAVEFATANSAGQMTRLWIYSPDPQFAVPWEYLHVPREYRPLFGRFNIEKGFLGCIRGSSWCIAAVPPVRGARIRAAEDR